MAYFLISWCSAHFACEPVAKAAPTRLVWRSFSVFAAGNGGKPSVYRQIQFGAPRSWTPTGVGGARPEMVLAGPEGEGFIAIYAGLHPLHLEPILERLRKEHPSAAPTSPQLLSLPGLRTDLGERATRFPIAGREVGEMVLIEMNQTIVMVVTVVAPTAWRRVKVAVAKMYPTISIVDPKLSTGKSKW